MLLIKMFLAVINRNKIAINRYLFVSMIIFIINFSLPFFIQSYKTVASDLPSPSLLNINPNPNGEPWIAGGISKTDWDSSIATMPALENPPLNRLGKTLAKPLPLKIDNTTYQNFRPIFSQQGGSCTQASTIGYVYTYEINYIRGLASNISSNQYPYDFTYNFVNAGSGENGGLPEQAWSLVSSLGIPNVATYGGFGLAKYSQWVSGYPIYYNAMTNRLDSYFRINTSTAAGVTQMKQWLNDHQNGSSQGGCLVMCYYATGETLSTIQAGLPEAGKKIMNKFGASGGHAVTIAGYNDSICFDYNGDGKYTNSNTSDVKTWEIGAFLMVNSWGKSFANSGKVWIPYRMLAASNGIWSSTLYGMKTQSDKIYSPKLTYKIAMTHTNRSMIRIRAGYANSSTGALSTKTLKSFANAFNFTGGTFPMQGVNNDTMEFGLDVSSFIPSLTDTAVSLYLSIDSKGGTGKIASFSVLDYSLGTTPIETFCQQLPVNIPIGTTNLKIVKLQKKLILLTPNGNEKLRRTQHYDIIWKNSYSHNVTIALLKNNVLVSTIDTTAIVNDTFHWTVPANCELGSDYRLSISSVNDSIAGDLSDTTFSIIDADIKTFVNTSAIQKASVFSMIKYGNKIRVKAAYGDLHIFTMDGKKTMSFVVKGDCTVNVATLSKGMYIAKCDNQMLRFVQ